MNNTYFNIDGFTIVVCLVIITAFGLSCKYISTTNKDNFDSKKKWMEQLPSFVSTLGVFGTFLGITKGLLGFDTNNLNISIPLLLDGMKTAFFTSLFGMMGAMILNRIVSKKLGEVESNHDSEEVKAAKLIINAMVKNCASLERTIETNSDKIVNSIKDNSQMITQSVSTSTTNLTTTIQDNQIVKKISIDVEQVKDDIEEIKGRDEEGNEKLNQLLNAAENLRHEVARLRAVAVTGTTSVSSLDNSTEEIINRLNDIGSAIDDIKDAVNKSQD